MAGRTAAGSQEQDWERTWESWRWDPPSRERHQSRWRRSRWRAGRCWTGAGPPAVSEWLSARGKDGGSRPAARSGERGPVCRAHAGVARRGPARQASRRTASPGVARRRPTALGWGCSEEVEVAAAYVALCLRCRPVSMTRATLRAGPAIPGGLSTRCIRSPTVTGTDGAG